MFLKLVLSFCLFFAVVFDQFSLSTMTEGQYLVPLGLKVTQLVHYGSKMTLVCKYKLGTATLHSVKWYKDGELFYAFSPQLKPQIKFYPLKQIQFDESQSDMHKAAFYNVTSDCSGSYKCEINAENPKTSKVQRTSLIIFAYPDRDPIIQFKRYRYNPDEEITVNCTSGKTIPPSTLFWFINGVKIDKKLVIKEEIKAIGGFFRTSSTIKFTPEKDLNQLVVGCVASILNSLPVTRSSVRVSTENSMQNHVEKLLHGPYGHFAVFILWMVELII